MAALRADAAGRLPIIIIFFITITAVRPTADRLPHSRQRIGHAARAVHGRASAVAVCLFLPVYEPILFPAVLPGAAEQRAGQRQQRFQPAQVAHLAAHRLVESAAGRHLRHGVAASVQRI